MKKYNIGTMSFTIKHVTDIINSIYLNLLD